MKATTMATGTATFELGGGPVQIEDVAAVAAGTVEKIVMHEALPGRLQVTADVVAERVARGDPTYGVNTGFGNSVTAKVPRERARELARNLPRFHGCGVGPMLGEQSSRAVVAVRLASLATGYSGVRPVVVGNLCRLLGAKVAPVIPARGSVGASGDLTPLSYVAALLMGEREAWSNGEIVPAPRALEAAGVRPLELEPKESLAIMNGTSVMVAEACLAFVRTQRLARIASALTAMMIEATDGQPAHFDERLFRAKPHPGQLECARWIRAALDVPAHPEPRGPNMQQPYSLRCAPHVIGVLLDALTASRDVLTIEINGANDNPLLDPETGAVLHGGNFYGGHAALVADMAKAQVANVADLMERQLVLLNDPKRNGGLPANLVAAPDAERSVQHGFKAMEITASALTAEALKATMPASVFSRSTEQHNQDKVSMGSLSTRDWAHILDLTETVAAVHLIACAQAVELRGVERVSEPVRNLRDCIRSAVAPLREDRPMDADIVTTLDLVRSDRLPLVDRG